jgi:hypothetical protein
MLPGLTLSASAAPRAPMACCTACRGVVPFLISSAAWSGPCPLDCPAVPGSAEDASLPGTFVRLPSWASWRDRLGVEGGRDSMREPWE